MNAQAQLQALRAPLAEGFLETKKIGLLQINGRDAKRFLQSQTTNNLDLLSEFSSQVSALTDRKAHLKGLFVLFQTKPEAAYTLLADANCLADIKEHLEKFLFADKVEISTTHSANFLLLGPRSLALLARLAYPQEFNADNQLKRPVESDCWSAPLRREYAELTFDLAALCALLPAQTVQGEHFANIPADDLHIPVSLYRLPSPQFTLLISCPLQHQNLLREALEQLAHTLNFPATAEESYLAQRRLGNWPYWQEDINEENLLVELGLEHESISYNKGCYQGQEVVARVKAFGAPARQIVGLSFDLAQAEQEQLDRYLKTNKKVALLNETTKNSISTAGGAEPEVGFLTSLYASQAPTQKNSRILALATLKRAYVNPQVPLQAQIDLDGSILKITAAVQLLPFLPPASLSTEAKRLYDEALYCFSADQEKRAVTLLEAALLMAPEWEELYEALGVILSKTERLEEAIALMQKLARLNPDSVMAHANLSVFYLEQGDKEKAEMEKAESMVIRMRLAAKEAMKEQKSNAALKEEEERLRQETSERMKMFQEVLAIDAEDLFANHGLGACHNLLKEYKLARPYLEKALALKANHAQAHLELGIALEGLGEREQALEAYKKGIEAAAHRSDKTLLLALQAKHDNLAK